MTFKHQAALASLLDRVRALDEASVGETGITDISIEITKSEDDNGICVYGNVSGLIHLARLVLEVAKRDIPGAHQHIDESSIADVCEVPLLIGLKTVS